MLLGNCHSQIACYFKKKQEGRYSCSLAARSSLPRYKTITVNTQLVHSLISYIMDIVQSQSISIKSQLNMQLTSSQLHLDIVNTHANIDQLP
jgi:hypothetical protein